MRKITTLLAMLAFMVSTAMAQQVNVSEAMSRAKTFLQSNTSGRMKSAAKTDASELTLAYTCKDKADKNVCYYVFNSGDSFVIVGGDEAAQEILGYSDNGAFDYDKAPENFKWWLSQYQQQITSAINYAEANPEAAKAARAKAARKKASAKTDIAPKLTTIWDQTAPFNNAVNAAFKTQTGVNVDFATGCVATAMAQVLYNHKAITKGSGSATGTTINYTINNSSYPFTPHVDFLESYDWDNMLTDYSGSYTEAQGEAIATLMYHAGVSVDMQYNSSSSASIAKVPGAFADHFGYDKSIRYEERKYYGNDDEDWEDMIYTELKNNGPVIYGGQDKNSSNGHCFVCDGYKASDNTFHISWGWSGHYDCYCSLTVTKALAPGGSGTGGSGATAEYSRDQQAVINVKENNNGLESPILFNYQNNLILNDGSNDVTSYNHTHGTSKTLTLTGNVWNCSRTLTEFKLGIKATDTTTGLTYYFPNSENTTLSLTSYTDKTLSFDVDELPYNGTYEIKMVGRNTASTSNDDWYEVGVASTVTIPTVVVSGTTDPEKTDVAFTISGTEVQAKRTLQISHPSSYSGSVTYTSNNESVATVNANGVVTGVSEGTATITAYAAGNTYFNETTTTFNVTVTPFVKSDADVTIAATNLSVGETANITISTGYDGTASYESSDETVATVSGGVVTTHSAGSATITVTLPETENYNAKTATFNVTVTGDNIYLTEAPYFSNDNNPWPEDGLLHYSIKNNSSSTTVYFYTMLYKITGSAEEFVGGSGTSWSNVGTNATVTSTFDINSKYSDYLTKGQKYKLKLISSNDWETKYNIPSITFTYRDKLEHAYTLTSAGIGTLILPFDAEIPTKDDSNNAISWKAYECNSKSGNTLVLNEVTILKRNTPYIITGDAATYTFTGPEAVDASPILFGDGILKGTMLDTYQFQTGDYILQNQTNYGIAFYPYSSGTWTAAPYRAFIQLGSSASLSCAAIPGFTKDIATDINAATGTTKAAGIYTIGGMKINQFQPGLNIIVDEQGHTTKVFIKK